MEFNCVTAKRLVETSEIKRPAIAAKCGITVGTLTKYLNGHGDPGIPVVKLLAQVLDVPEATLWIDKNEGPSAA